MIDPRRIAVIGNAGGGKTLWARRIGQRLHAPLLVIDDVQWRPGWERAESGAVARAQSALLDRDTWVIDGWGDWVAIEARFERATLIVVVDYSMRRHYWWAMKRQIEAAVGWRTDWPPPGCRALPITLRLIRHMQHVNAEYRPQLLALVRRPHLAHKTAVITAPRELQVLEWQLTSG